MGMGAYTQKGFFVSIKWDNTYKTPDIKEYVGKLLIPSNIPLLQRKENLSISWEILFIYL